MPSRQILTENSAALHHHRHRIVPFVIGGVAAVIFVLIALIIYYYFRKLKHKSTFNSTTDSKPPHRFSYSALRRATASFSASRLLGQGGFGSVYAGTLTNDFDIAVKVMDAGSLQGEREFQNELFLAAKFDSKYILSVIGFSSDRKQRRMLLVYELMTNGSLQHCLFQCKSVQLQFWKIRFSIALDIAKGLEYLHHYCDPPVIHGDIKPSNILLDSNFNAKIGDFGLALLKLKDPSIVEINKEFTNQIDGPVIKDADSSPVDELSMCLDGSPESCVSLKIGEASPDLASPDLASPLEIDTTSVFCQGNIDRASVECGKETTDGKRTRSGSRKDWWWKQDTGGEQRGPVKDYVTEWIGNEIKKERPKSNWIVGSSSSGVMGKSERKKKSRKTLDWWVSLDDDKNLKKEKRRPAREWWKEEYCEELTRKKKEKKKQGNSMCTNDKMNGENWWPRDNDDLYVERKTKRCRSKGSQGSVDWYFDGLGSELGRARRSSHDSVSGDLPRSGAVSSTPSMRGTVCYIAPEYCTGATVSDKCDVYSFGVVLLVLISGRRPLQVTESPVREFQRANLLYWTRHLARAGKLLDLVDQSIHSLDNEQALLCITVALLCLQKSPLHRPSMKEVVAMLAGDLEPPRLPVELTPSPPSASKSQKKPR